MATHYKSTTETYELEAHNTGSDGGDRWQHVKLVVTVDASGNGSWTITTTNDSSENGIGDGRGIYLKITLDGTYIQGSAKAGYTDYNSSSDSRWKTYPTGHNTSKTGTFTTTAESISINMKLGCMTNKAQKEKTWTFTRDTWADGTCSVAVVYDDALRNKNKYKIKYTITPGDNNELTNATLFWSDDGSDATSGKSEGVSASGTSGEKSVPSSAASSTIKVRLNCNFKHNYPIDDDSKTVYYYSQGSALSTPTIVNNENNSFKIGYVVGTAGKYNNKIRSATVHYTIDGKEKTFAISDLTTGKTVKYTSDIEVTKDTTVTAWITRDMEWSGANANTKTSSKTSDVTIPYYAPIKTNPAVSITDNGNNTFTITGTDATGGNVNNTVSTTYSWSYDSASYNQSGTGTKNLNIATPTNATRAVYAKANAALSVFGDPVEVKATPNNPVYIKQYVAPGNPGTPVLFYSKSRLTVKEPWVFTWTAASPTNASSPVKGYRLTLFKNGTERSNSIPIKNSSGTDISRYVDSVYIYDTSDLSFTVYPDVNGFAPGDTVVLAVRPYIQTPTGLCLYNNDNTYSAATTVQNAGIVHVKVDGTTWKEGQVWVKTGDGWKEAESILTKTTDGWKESQ